MDYTLHILTYWLINKVVIELLFDRHYIPARAGATRIRAKGIFPRAKVVRGIDWEYGDEYGK